MYVSLETTAFWQKISTWEEYISVFIEEQWSLSRTLPTIYDYMRLQSLVPHGLHPAGTEKVI